LPWTKLDQTFFAFNEIGSNFLSLPWMKLDQTFFDLDEIGSNFLWLGWNWIKLSLPSMKLDQTFFDLVSSGTHLSLHHVGFKDGCTPKDTWCIDYRQNKPTASKPTQWWMVGGR
jgi:hypothetical protein